MGKSNEWISYNQKLDTKVGAQDSFVINEQFELKALEVNYWRHAHVTGSSLLALKWESPVDT